MLSEQNGGAMSARKRGSTRTDVAVGAKEAIDDIPFCRAQRRAAIYLEY